MTRSKKTLTGLAVLAAACFASLGAPSNAEAHGYYRRNYHRPYPSYRSYYYGAPVVYSAPVYYSAPVVYPAPVVYTRPVYYSRPYYYTPSGFSFGYYGNGGHHHGGVSVHLGF